MNIQEEIFRTIENIAGKNSSSAPIDIPTVILGVNKNGKYMVKINGVERLAKDGIGLNLKVGTNVWVHAMNGDFKNLYIISRR